MDAWSYDVLLNAAFWALVVCSLWTWMTLLAFQVFRISMRRARVKPVHVLRCVVYSFDIGAWLGILLALAAVVTIWVQPWQPDSDYSGVVATSLSILWWVLVTYRLVRPDGDAGESA